MQMKALALDGAYLLIPEPIRDNRGFFARCFSRAPLEAAGLCTDFPEWSLSYNAQAGTLRGMHWQAAPHLEVKIVQCVRGAVFDVLVDMRPNSATFGKWVGVELTAENRHLLYIPKGLAHGFQTLADESELLYHISEPFQPQASRGVRWDDPDLAIAWPTAPNRILSERDATLPSFMEIKRL